MFELAHKNIVVTGGGGFLGSWVVKRLKSEKPAHILIPHSREFDLRNRAACEKLVVGQEILIHIAAHVGGIGLNKEHPGQLFYNNAIMGIELMEAARKAGVKKMVVIGTACSYPKYGTVPFSESAFWDGEPDEVTGVYGLAKKMLLVQAQAYRKEYHFNAIYLILVNLYGPGDNFDPEYGHVIPSLIRRMVEAKNKREKKFVVWGSGTATREFIYVADAAEAIVAATKKYDGLDPVNIGSGREISIRDLVHILKTEIRYTGEIVWDVTKPDGQPRRLVSIERAQHELGFVAETPLEVGLRRTIRWYLEKQKDYV